VRAIAPRLWIGPSLLPEQEITGIDLVVLCASELQPELPLFFGSILRCPLPPKTLTFEDARRALMASVAIAQDVSHGKRVLLCCDPSMRRCSLVAALAMSHLTTISTDRVLELLVKKIGRQMSKEQQTMLRKVVGAGRKRNPSRGQGCRRFST
jgi:hypothetical protein